MIKLPCLSNNHNTQSTIRYIKGLSPVKKRLLFHGNLTKNEKARRLKWAICLYLTICASLSFLLLTWTMMASINHSISHSAGSGGGGGGGGGGTVHGHLEVFPTDEWVRNPFNRVRSQRNLSWKSNDKEGKTQHYVNNDEHHSTTVQPFQQRFHLRPQNDSPDTEETYASGKQYQSQQYNQLQQQQQPIPPELQIPDEEPIVQIINTRFMQNQPDLVELGLARLELMRTICLPTLQQQTSQNFLWIIRADPDLHPTIKTGLLNMIATATQETPDFHVVVMGSNDNPSGFRRANHILVSPELVWTDNYNLLQHFQQASQSRIVLETRLDADDGLHIYFVELMQEEAILYLSQANDDPQTENRTNTSSSGNWLVWCAGTHVEWQYGTPWGDLLQSNRTKTEILLNGTEVTVNPNRWKSTLPRMKQKDASSQPQQDDNDKDSDAYGSLLPGLTRGCITPGLTKGYSAQANFEDIPEAQHHHLHLKIEQCHELKQGESQLSVPTSEFNKCLVVWRRLIPNAIRGRTPTSAGMQFVLGKHTSFLSEEAKDALGLEEIDYKEMQPSKFCMKLCL